MSKTILFTLIILTSQAFAEDYVTEPIATMEAGILNDTDEIQGKSKDGACFIRIFRSNYKQTIQYHIDFSTLGEISHRTSSNTYSDTLWSTVQITDQTSNSITFYGIKNNEFYKKRTWTLSMNEQKKKLISVDFKEGIFSKTKKCEL